MYLDRFGEVERVKQIFYEAFGRDAVIEKIWGACRYYSLFTRYTFVNPEGAKLPTIIAMMAACAAPLFLNFALPGLIPNSMRSILDLAAWVVAFYFVKKLLTDLRP